MDYGTGLKNYSLKVYYFLAEDGTEMAKMIYVSLDAPYESSIGTLLRKDWERGRETIVQSCREYGIHLVIMQVDRSCQDKVLKGWRDLP